MEEKINTKKKKKIRDSVKARFVIFLNNKV